MSPDSLLTPDEAAEYLRLPPRQLQQLRYLGRGPAFHRLGRHIRYAKRDLDAYRDAGRVEPEKAESRTAV